MSIRKWGLTPLALATLMGVSGCNLLEGDSSNSVTSTTSTVAVKSVASFAGRVVDVNGDAISGAEISIFANKKYTTSTDGDGNYLVEVDMGDVVAAPGGGSSSSGGFEPADSDLGNSQDNINRQFPIEIKKSGFASFRHVVNFNGIIGYTDGSGAVVLLSQVGSILPKTTMVPYVSDFKFTVYAGSAPAAGAIVNLQGSRNSAPTPPTWNADHDTSDYVLTGYKLFTADANGVVTITAADKVPASGEYTAFVAPYDADADGQFEYDSTLKSKIFNLSANQNDSTTMIHDDGTGALVGTQNAPSIYMVDGSNDITVVYNSLQSFGNGSIPQAEAAGFDITVMLNRPVTPEMLAGIGGPLFSLTANNGNTPIPVTVSNVGGYLYTIAPDITLDPSRNTYRLSMNTAVSYAGGTGISGSTSFFNFYDPNATLSGAIVPGLDIDDDTTYKVDWRRFLVGDMTSDNPLDTDNTQGGIHFNDRLRLSFMADATATGYQVWVKDSDSPWIETGFTTTYNDGQAIELTVNDVFSPNFAGGEFIASGNTGVFAEALLDSNTMQVVVMPENINGFATDPNTDNTIAGLSLADNWGPEVRGASGGPSFSGVTTSFTGGPFGTTCDAQGVVLSVSEPLSSAQTLIAEFAAGENGAKAVTGSSCFTVGAVRFTDNDLVDPSVAGSEYPSNFTYIEVDLVPAVTTMTAADADAGDNIITVTSNATFAIGDDIQIGDELLTREITGLIGANTITVDFGLSTDQASGSAVYWVGPVESGNADVSGTLAILASDALENLVTVDDTSVLVDGESALLGAVVTSTSTFGDFPSANLSALGSTVVAPGGNVGGYHVGSTAGDAGGVDDDAVDADAIANLTLTLPVLAGTNVTITVNSTADLATGNVVALDFLNNALRELVPVTVVDATTFTATIAFDHGIGSTAQEIDSFTLMSPSGFPFVRVDDNDNMKAGSSFTVTDINDASETQTVTVAAVYTLAPNFDYIVPSAKLRTSLPTAFGVDSGFVNDSARGPDALEVQLTDRSSNTSDDTDTDGDMEGNFDQIGYEEVGGSFGRF